MKKYLFVFMTMLGMTAGVFGQVTLKGEFRPKFEPRDGYKTLLSDDRHADFLTAQRSRLSLNSSKQTKTNNLPTIW